MTTRKRAIYRQVKQTLRMSWIRLYDYPTTASHPLADKLNEFYCRFGGAITSISPSDSDTSQLCASPDCLSLLSGVRSQDPAARMGQDGVCQLFRREKPRKAPDPDGMPPFDLYWTAYPQLHSGLQEISGAVWRPLVSNVPGLLPWHLWS